MANIQERAELHKTIWKIANDLRGSVDGWEFKAYVLGSIFYRFISENICDYFNKRMHDLGYAGFSYADMSDEQALNAHLVQDGTTGLANARSEESACSNIKAPL